METPHFNNRNLEASWQYYRQCFENEDRPQGMEIPGLTSEEFEAVINDTQTACLRTPVFDSLYTLPLATSIDNLEWYNKAYFQNVARLAGINPEAPIVFYNHLPTPLRTEPGAYVAALETLFYSVADASGLLVFDHLDAETSVILTELQTVLAALGLEGSDVLPQVDPNAYHFNHAGFVTLADPTDRRELALNLFEAYEQGCVAGRFNPDGVVTIQSSLNLGDITHIWEFYKAAFDELTAEDPIRASSPYGEFESLLQDERIVKMVERSTEQIVSLCLFGDVRLFPWANQYYYAQAFPDEYEKGLVFFFPGIIRDPDSTGDGRRVMAPMGRLLAAAGIEKSVISFVCDKTSEKPVSVMGTWVLNHSGVVADLKQPESQRIFHAYRLGRQNAF